MKSNTDLVRTYLEAMYPGTNRLEEVRELLADDLVYIDPLMQVQDADDLVQQVRTLGPGDGDPQPTHVRSLLGEADTVAALTAFVGPHGSDIIYSQWFWILDHKIKRIEVIYDPRGFYPPSGSS